MTANAYLNKAILWQALRYFETISASSSHYQQITISMAGQKRTKSLVHPFDPQWSFAPLQLGYLGRLSPVVFSNCVDLQTSHRKCCTRLISHPRSSFILLFIVISFLPCVSHVILVQNASGFGRWLRTVRFVRVRERPPKSLDRSILDVARHEP
jgi:hypothetical protein